MNKKFLIIGAIALLVVGIASVFAMGDKWHGDKSWKKGWHHKEVGDKSAWFEKLGVSSDATKEEIMEAMHKWKTENKDFSKKSYKGCGFHK